MGLFDRLRALSNAPGTRQMQLSLRVGGSSSSSPWTFARVAESVYGNPTGYRCVEMRVNAFARPDWIVYKPGTEEVIEASPLLGVLNHGMVAGKMRLSATQGQKYIERDLCLAGRSLWVKQQGQSDDSIVGPTTGLTRLTPMRTSVLADNDDQLIGYIYADKQGGKFPLLPEQVVYIRYPHPTRDYDSLPPAIAAGLGAETDSGAARFNFDLLANDGALPGYLSLEDITPDEFREWKAAWESGEYPGKTRFLSGKAKYVRIGQSNQEMAYDQLRNASKQDIFHALGVPGVLVDPTDSTFANMAEARSMLIQQTILPDWTLVADELTEQIGGEFGCDVGLKLDDIAELSEAENAIVDRGVKLMAMQALTINEFREGQGWDPVPWGDVPAAPLAPMKATPIAAPGQSAPETPTHDTAPDIAPAKSKAILPVTAKAKRVTVDLSKVEAYEKQAERKMAAFFARQGKVVTAKIRGKAGKSLKAALRSEDVFDMDRWVSELSDDLKDMYRDLVDTFGTKTAAEIGKTGFNPDTETITKWITSRSTNVAKMVNDTTEEDLRQALADAVSNGDGIDAIVRKIGDYFEAPYRAETFARTEVIGASNYATLQAANQSGIATGKSWLTADGVDDDCATNEADGVIALDGTFSSGDDQPPAHPNCRCTVLIDTKDGAEENNQEDDSNE